MAILVVLAMLMGGRAGIYVDIPSVVFVFGCVIGGVWFAHGPAALFRAITAALTGRSDAEQAGRHDAVLGTAYGLSWSSGILGVFIGFIAMLADLSDPRAIGTGLAVCLLSVLYGVLLAELVFHPLRRALRSGGAGQRGPNPQAVSDRGPGLSIAAAVALVAVASFVLLTLHFNGTFDPPDAAALIKPDALAAMD